MLENLKIDNFKTHHSLRIDDLKAVNLIVGRNNTGKTSLLEAILLLTQVDGFRRALSRLYRLRGFDPAKEIGRAHV